MINNDIKRIAHLESVVAAGGKDAAKAKSELMNLKSHDEATDASNEVIDLLLILLLIWINSLFLSFCLFYF